MGTSGSTHSSNWLEQKVVTDVESCDDRRPVQVEDKIVIDGVVDLWEEGRDGHGRAQSQSGPVSSCSCLRMGEQDSDNYQRMMGTQMT